MSREVNITLSNSSGQEFPLLLRAVDNPIGKKWVSQLNRILQQSYILEKNFCFLGFSRKDRGFGEIVKDINQVLTVLKEIGEGDKNKVSAGLDVELLRSTFSSPLTQNDLNRLHHCFELLMGQTWNHSKHYLSADKKLRKSIRELNFLVHEYEALLHSLEKIKKGKPSHPITIVSFLHDGSTNIPIEKEDLPYFTLSNSFGSVKAHYAQTGKNHYDAWRDGDQEIFNDNISGLRVISGEFVINWWKCEEVPKEKMFSLFRDFYSWLEGKGYQVLDPSFVISPEGRWEGIGFPKLAEVEISRFETTDVSQIQNILAEFSNIKKIEIGTSQYDFPYFPYNDDFHQMVIERL